jgi:DNA-binding MarR family transcriptional regulator
MPIDADEPVAVWAAFLRAHAALTATLERELVAERDLPLAWYEVLLALRRADRPLRMQELAGSVLLSKSGLTRLVDRMEAAGLVERTSCPSDRRGVFVVPTRAGSAAFRAAAPVHLRGIGEHFTERLDGDDLRALAVALAKLLGEPAPEAAACGDLEPAAAAAPAPARV